MQIGIIRKTVHYKILILLMFIVLGSINIRTIDLNRICLLLGSEDRLEMIMRLGYFSRLNSNLVNIHLLLGSLGQEGFIVRSFRSTNSNLQLQEKEEWLMCSIIPDLSIFLLNSATRQFYMNLWLSLLFIISYVFFLFFFCLFLFLLLLFFYSHKR